MDKYMTDKVRAAIEAVKGYEEVDERMERLKRIWEGGLRKKIEGGMSQKAAFSICREAVAGDKKLEFSTFAKMLGKLAAATKKRKTPAQKNEAAAAATAVAQTASARAEKRAAKKASSAATPAAGQSTPAETPAQPSDLENDPLAPMKPQTKS